MRQGCRGDGVPHSEPNVVKLAVGPCHAPLSVRLIKLYVGIDRRRSRSSDAIAACRMLAFIHVFSICVYVLSICIVAAILFVSVDEIEPNHRLALALQVPHRLCGRRGNRNKTDALTAVGLRGYGLIEFSTK